MYIYIIVLYSGKTQILDDLLNSSCSAVRISQGSLLKITEITEDLFDVRPDLHKRSTHDGNHTELVEVLCNVRAQRGAYTISYQSHVRSICICVLDFWLVRTNRQQ